MLYLWIDPLIDQNANYQNITQHRAMTTTYLDNIDVDSARFPLVFRHHVFFFVDIDEQIQLSQLLSVFTRFSSSQFANTFFNWQLKDRMNITINLFKVNVKTSDRLIDVVLDCLLLTLSIFSTGIWDSII